MAYILKRNGKKSLWHEELNKGLYNFAKEKNWKYNFDYENEQPKKVDVEARYLSQRCFQEIIKYIDSSIKVHVTDDRFMCISYNEVKMKFHFDIMNNPKIGHSFGKNIKNNCEKRWYEWERRYHTIGNFAPIPWPKLQFGNINTQLIHCALDERWDLFLQLCKNEWPIWEKYGVILGFEIYMKITCQQMYYKKVFFEIKEKLTNRDIKKISDDELIKWFHEWNKVDYKDEELILFSEDTNEAVKDILLLIEIRGRLIIKILEMGISKI